MEVEPSSVSIRMERWKILPGNRSKKRTGELIQVVGRAFFQNILIRYRGFVWLGDPLDSNILDKHGT